MPNKFIPKCKFCSASAAALINMPNGCLCSEQQYQYRCVQHILRANDTDEIYSLVATFPDFNLLRKMVQ